MGRFWGSRGSVDSTAAWISWLRAPPVPEEERDPERRAVAPGQPQHTPAVSRHEAGRRFRLLCPSRWVRRGAKWRAVEASPWARSPYLSSGGEAADPGAASCVV